VRNVSDSGVANGLALIQRSVTVGHGVSADLTEQKGSSANGVVEDVERNGLVDCMIS